MFLTSIAARLPVAFFKQNQFFEPSREVLLGCLFFFLLFFFSSNFGFFDFVPTFSPMFLVFHQFLFFDPLIFFFFHSSPIFFFVAFLFIFFFRVHEFQFLLGKICIAHSVTHSFTLLL